MGLIKNLFSKQIDSDLEKKKRDLVHGVISMSDHPQFRNFFYVTFVDMEDRKWNVFATIDEGMEDPISVLVKMQKDLNELNKKEVVNGK